MKDITVQPSIDLTKAFDSVNHRIPQTQQPWFLKCLPRLVHQLLLGQSSVCQIGRPVVQTSCSLYGGATGFNSRADSFFVYTSMMSLMLLVILGTAFAMMMQNGTPVDIIAEASIKAPELGQVANQPLASYLGSFVIWAAAIPVIPHIVMRVFSAKDSEGARLSLNIAMVMYSIMILAAVMVIVPVGKMSFPNLQDADQIFLEVMKKRKKL